MKRALLRVSLLVFLLSLAACAGILGIKPSSSSSSSSSFGHSDGERPFEHRAHTTLGISCTTCHTTGAPAASLIPSSATCTSSACHAKPHDTSGRACGTCHGEKHTREEAAIARSHLRFDHDRHLGKVSGQCVPCHAAVGKSEPFAATSLRPPMAQCFGCHAHKDQWQSRECDGCHVDLPAERVLPSTHVIHEGDFLREHGVRAASQRDLCATCHSESSCTACHGVTTPALPSRLAFDRPTAPMTGLHRAGFASRHSDEARANPGLCVTCHGGGEGGGAARFCADCHARKGRASAATTANDGRLVPGTTVTNPHPPTWVRARGGDHGRAARMDPMSCASCHGGAGEALCVGCHRVGGPGGNPHGRGFASTLDPQRDLPCRQCHYGATAPPR